MIERFCNRCQTPKPASEWKPGKAHCRSCRNEQWTNHKMERRDRERREAEAHLARILNWPVPGVLR